MKLVECVPNFSEGKDLAKIKTITNLGSVVISVALVTLQIIDLFTNENNNPAISDGNETDEG